MADGPATVWLPAAGLTGALRRRHCDPHSRFGTNVTGTDFKLGTGGTGVFRLRFCCGNRYNRWKAVKAP
eukprot:99112-Hanusia_phi.AAC.1